LTLEAVTQAPWLLPAFAAASAVLSGALLAKHAGTGSRFVNIWVAAFAATTLADAFLTSKLSPLGGSTAMAIFFVILGDFRLFLLAEKVARPLGPSLTAARRALTFAFITPVLQRGVAFLLPEHFAGKDLRFTFLTYEVICLVTLAVYAKRSTREGDDAHVAVGDRLIGFFALQYALWAIADALILYAPSFRDIGFGLRLIPNVMYYGVFVPFGYAQAAPRVSK